MSTVSKEKVIRLKKAPIVISDEDVTISRMDTAVVAEFSDQYYKHAPVSKEVMDDVLDYDRRYSIAIIDKSEEIAKEYMNTDGVRTVNVHSDFRQGTMDVSYNLDKEIDGKSDVHITVHHKDPNLDLSSKIKKSKANIKNALKKI